MSFPLVRTQADSPRRIGNPSSERLSASHSRTRLPAASAEVYLPPTAPKAIRADQRRSDTKSYRFYGLFSKPAIVILILLFFPCTDAHSKEPKDASEPQVFSNKDLENYMLPTYDKTPGTATNNGLTSGEDDMKRRAREIREQDEQEYWCKKASTYTKQIDNSKNNVKDSENALSELTNSLLSAGGRKRKSIEKEINKTEQTLKMDKKRLREKEEDLAELEGEAHRKGIPPGWLRCQFE
jgi:hypothetical protein